MRASVLSFLAVLVSAGAVNAADRENQARPIPARVLARFDSDKDGKLNAEERKRARSALAKQNRAGNGNTAGRNNQRSRAEVLKRFDVNGDGKLSEQERRKMRQRLANTGAANPANPTPNSPAVARREMLKRFDKDGDGKLNKQEQAAARKFAQQRFSGSLKRPEVIKRFDKNADGKLDATERRAAMLEFRKLATNANRNQAPQAAPRATRVDQASLLKEFDRDGNGALSSAERSAALRAMQN